MATTICIFGESGSGKTTSLKALNPKHTYIIDADGKGLAWRGWRTQYSTEKQNYIVTADMDKVLALLENINEHAPHIKVVVVDTLNAVMLADERSHKDDNSFQKWSDLAFGILDIVNYAIAMRDDMFAIFTAHSETERDINTGFAFTRIKTIGKKLDKITLESKMRTVLHAKRAEGIYIFETRSDNSTAKDGMGGELPDQMPNDIVPILSALKAFDTDEEAKGDDAC